LPNPTRRSLLKTCLCAGLCSAIPPLTSELLPASITHAPNRLRFGVNYVPRKHWWYCWQDWDRQAICDDFRAIADLGMDHIRVQCIWPFFQPEIDQVSERVLERLRSMMDVASLAGLDVEVTVLNGWMSGIAFMPNWLRQAGIRRNIFTEGDVVGAEKVLFRKIAESVASHPRFLGFDLGNELGVLQGMEDPATTRQSDEWAMDMLGFCNQIAPGKFHVNGVDHEHWFADYGFSRETLATTGSATVVHSYAYFTEALKHYGYSGVGSLHLAEYMVELAYAYQADQQRRVWVEEVGVSPSWVPDYDLSSYAERTVRNTAETGKAWGITWWCSHDLDPTIKGFNDLEYTLGLIGQDNKPKPLGKKLSALAAEFRDKQASSTDRKTALVIPDKGLSQRPSPPDWTYGSAYMKLVSQGKKPCIVLKSNAHDEEYLRARGIHEMIYLSDLRG
jgi:endo-1,4-beta-mannosidase